MLLTSGDEQALDQRLLLESMTYDMAVLHSQSALLLRAVSGWRRVARASAEEQARATRHTMMWSKINVWLHEAKASPGTCNVPDSAAASSPQAQAFTGLLSGASCQGTSRQAFSNVLVPFADGRQAGSSRIPHLSMPVFEPGSCTQSQAGLASPYADELDALLEDTGPQLDVARLMQPVYPAQPSASNAATTVLDAAAITTTSLPEAAVHAQTAVCEATNTMRQDSAQSPGSIQEFASSQPAEGQQHCASECSPELGSECDGCTGMPAVPLVQSPNSTASGEQRTEHSNNLHQRTHAQCMRKSVHQKLAALASRPRSAHMTPAAEKLHRAPQLRGHASGQAVRESVTDAASVDMTPLKPTIRVGWHAKRRGGFAAPTARVASATAGRKPVRSSSTKGRNLAPCSEHRLAQTGGNHGPAATADGEELETPGSGPDSDSDDEFAWIMHRQLPRQRA
jgi:hypothetical protein